MPADTESASSVRNISAGSHGLRSAGPAEPDQSSGSIGPASGRSQSFPRRNRILKSADFRRVYDHGLRVTTPLFTAFCLAIEARGRSAGPRVGFTVPRSLGKAVRRNRVRRRVREAVRLALSEIDRKWDIVINPRRAAFDAPFAALQAEVRKLVNRCGR